MTMAVTHPAVTAGSVPHLSPCSLADPTGNSQTGNGRANGRFVRYNSLDVPAGFALAEGKKGTKETMTRRLAEQHSGSGANALNEENPLLQLARATASRRGFQHIHGRFAKTAMPDSSSITNSLG
jgi:hypothetical protein